eukprot:TRINITY_DN2890_c0_g1_i1.p1 TRINITY_DN2890_c0_g1~~TRINITY_DN2890_c0_g1_i1.p1  ORF type:complete len:121 (+),score=7.04 TRINITY_DN2890_c0_g1_i1:216-578(+)
MLRHAKNLVEAKKSGRLFSPSSSSSSSPSRSSFPAANWASLDHPSSEGCAPSSSDAYCPSLCQPSSCSSLRSEFEFVGVLSPCNGCDEDARTGIELKGQTLLRAEPTAFLSCPSVYQSTT